uniref:Uncharacterized protein n=1 Tax=uncultured marine virus TaxID=186617 RepID=A0A0F7L559_9VIRU|nr:hypothetical protein [uncultured marine virus]
MMSSHSGRWANSTGAATGMAWFGALPSGRVRVSRISRRDLELQLGCVFARR